MTLCKVEDAVADIRDGRFVIIVDDEDRENEGDLAIAADRITPEAVNFMATHARGLICVATEGWRLDELGLTAMVDENTSQFGTAFTVSVDAVGRGVTTGISAFDRATTVKLLTDEHARPADFAKPGHTFPLRARRGGVLERAGQTEAIVDLCKAAGRYPAGVICEIMREDGSMARRDDLDVFAAEHGLKIVAINDLIAYRRRTERLVLHGAVTEIPTPWGVFAAHGFEDVITHATHVALALGSVDDGEPVLVRVHSECLTGDVFGSQRCDCQAQLHKALQIIGEEGRGVLVYLRQEGRGIGLLDKLRAYALQDEGLDTVQANQHLGLPVDKRDYGIGTQILADLGVTRARILTNNPRKWHGLAGYGMEVVEQLPLVIPPTRYNERYLRAKRDKMGHLLGALDDTTPP
ncbi:MAG TPA: bifunctional 3,4-dihydroxy-2-butanone-4-phosphate synthase/GTP cyclohydrolase II [Candidatus Dormibacteraeota bacterium]|nr:bifunctional 3,4-dihydroxy-2-butanone-4-phosphate synthase/GTP cyclohydrolase II [Candidatus Dormibacteraeota bacterium]